MPSLDLTKNELKYFASDENTLLRAATLLTAIAGHDKAAAQDATTALNAVNHVLKHVTRKRGGSVEQAINSPNAKLAS